MLQNSRGNHVCKLSVCPCPWGFGWVRSANPENPDGLGRRIGMPDTDQPAKINRHKPSIPVCEIARFSCFTPFIDVFFTL